MSNQSNSPLDHLAAHAIAFAVGAIVVLTGQAYGMYVRHRMHRAAQCSKNTQAKPRSTFSLISEFHT